MRVLIAIAVMLTFVNESQAQDIKHEFEQMNTYLSTLGNYQMTVDYSAADGTDLHESGQVSVYVGNEGLFYNLGEGNSMIINEEKLILIDDRERTIVYSENQKVKKRKSVDMLENMMNGLDSLVANCDSVTYYESNGVRTYNLRMEGSYFNLVQVHFKGTVLDQVDYFYNDDFVDMAGIKTTCKVDIKSSEDFDAKYLESSFYLTESEGAVAPSQHFTNYLIIYNGSLESFMD